MSVVEGVASDDLHVALTTFDGLDTFRSLSVAEQQKFVAWIAKARGEAAYWGRIDSLVMAMRVTPVQPDTARKLASVLEVP